MEAQNLHTDWSDKIQPPPPPRKAYNNDKFGKNDKIVARLQEDLATMRLELNQTRGMVQELRDQVAELMAAPAKKLVKKEG